MNYGVSVYEISRLVARRKIQVSTSAFPLFMEPSHTKKDLNEKYGRINAVICVARASYITMVPEMMT